MHNPTSNGVSAYCSQSKKLRVSFALVLQRLAHAIQIQPATARFYPDREKIIIFSLSGSLCDLQSTTRKAGLEAIVTEHSFKGCYLR